jgi:hypothetical protein
MPGAQFIKTVSLLVGDGRRDHVFGNLEQAPAFQKQQLPLQSPAARMWLAFFGAFGAGAHCRTWRWGFVDRLVEGTLHFRLLCDALLALAPNCPLARTN